MKLSKILLKIVAWLIIITVSISVAGYFYLKSTWQELITDHELTELVTRIKFAEDLPDKFYELYEKENPDILSESLNKQIVTGFISNNFIKSPSLNAAMISEFSRKDGDSTRISNRKAYTIAWKLEEQTTQKECLNWVLDNYKFDLYIHGIKEISQFYYKKSVSELSEKELKDIILLMKKPSIVAVPDRSDEQLPE
jgi:hypothetical protein